MDLIALKSELDTDPLARGYAGMGDAAAATSLNDATSGRTRNIDTLTAAQIYEAMDSAEFAALSVGDKTLVDRILGLGGDVLLTATSQAKAVLLAVFAGAAGTITRPAIGAAISEDVSRGVELGFGFVGHADVQDARMI